MQPELRYRLAVGNLRYSARKVFVIDPKLREWNFCKVTIAQLQCLSNGRRDPIEDVRLVNGSTAVFLVEDRASPKLASV
jgi:hypothetical protein